jgi:hypothetical protein
MYPIHCERMIERFARARFASAVGSGPAPLSQKDSGPFSAEQFRKAASQYARRAAQAVSHEKLEYEALARRFTEEAENAEHWQQA